MQQIIEELYDSEKCKDLKELLEELEAVQFDPEIPFEKEPGFVNRKKYYEK